MASWVAPAGVVIPVTFRTKCRAAASTSSRVAGVSGREAP
jgi:hypothetical protein